MKSIPRSGGAATRGLRWRPCSGAPPASQVRTVRVSISPDNIASYQLAMQYGFTEVGQQWDDEDGLEIIYEVDAGHPSSRTGPA